MSLSLKHASLFFGLFLGGCASPKIAAITPASPQAGDQIIEKFETKALEANPANSTNPPILASSEKAPNKGKSETKKKAPVLGNKNEVAAPPSVSPSPSPAASPVARIGSFLIPNRRPEKIPFWVGEKQVMDVTYLGMVAGQFELEVLPMKVINNQKVFHFEGRAKSSSIFKIVYSLDDKVESFMDARGLFSYKYHLLLDQTRQKRDSLEIYDHEKKQVYYWNRKNHVTKGFSEIKEFKPMEPMTQDSFSAFHYLRSLPLETGKVYAVPVVSEGNSWEGVATVVRREVASTSLGKIPSIVIKLQTRFQGVLKQGQGDSFIWLSDDDRRFILQFEAKVKIGSVIGVIKKIVPGEKPAEN
jgi:hypothetical protein